jgi:hypothetical protein
MSIDNECMHSSCISTCYHHYSFQCSTFIDQIKTPLNEFGGLICEENMSIYLQTL